MRKRAERVPLSVLWVRVSRAEFLGHRLDCCGAAKPNCPELRVARLWDGWRARCLHFPEGFFFCHIYPITINNHAITIRITIHILAFQNSTFKICGINLKLEVAIFCQ